VTPRYLEVEMPKRFALEFKAEDGEWMLEAICLAEHFYRQKDGSYVCGEFSSGLWIRCIAHHNWGLDHVDGGGDVHRYRLVPLPMAPE
jgi:hypothetical protein